MRVIEIFVVGTAAAYLALSYSSSGSGYLQAASFLVALTVATLTVGCALAIGLHAWPDDAGLAVAGPRFLHRCHECGRRMRRERSAWVCLRCDRSPLRAGIAG